MPLVACSDTSPADWLVAAATDEAAVWRVITQGPDGFAAYGRLRFIPDPARQGMQEADAEVPEDHPTDIASARRALQLLAANTATPDDCWFCVWDGFSWTGQEELARGPLVSIGPPLPWRQYVLFRGTLDDLDSWEEHFGLGGVVPPAFAWPADHAWCFTADVDPHWAMIGAGEDAVDALLADQELDVVPADPAVPPPTYY